MPEPCSATAARAARIRCASPEEVERAEYGYYLQRVQPGHIVADIGASVGTLAVFFANLVGPTGIVHAFEPGRWAYRALRLVARTAGSGNIVAHRLAVSDQSGATELVVYDRQHQSWNGLRPRPLSTYGIPVRPEGRESVTSVTLDAFTAARGIDRFDLVKIDVEGAELQSFGAPASCFRPAGSAAWSSNSARRRSISATRRRRSRSCSTASVTSSPTSFRRTACFRANQRADGALRHARCGAADMTTRASWRWRSAWKNCRHGVVEWRRRRQAWRRFWSSYRAYCRMVPAAQHPPLHFLYPCLGDDTAETAIEPIYYYQDAWAFEKIVARRPARHVDVGSHHKFVALLSKVVPVTMVDIRPPALPLESLHFEPGSITALPFADRSLPSVSSLCVIEHIGLGRYGDELDPAGTEKAMGELQRVVAPGGDVYLSVPLHNENRTYFNAHRAFTEEYLLTLFAPFEVGERRYIFGNEFTAELRRGFGTGCYHLRAPASGARKSRRTLDGNRENGPPRDLVLQLRDALRVTTFFETGTYEGTRPLGGRLFFAGGHRRGFANPACRGPASLRGPGQPRVRARRFPPDSARAAAGAA